MNRLVEEVVSDKLKKFSFPQVLQHRAVGDLLEAEAINIIKDQFDSFRGAKSKRSIDDFSIVTPHGEFLYDVKTHYLQNTKGFSMPNLISIKYLKDVLEDPNKSLSYLFIDYTRQDEELVIRGVNVKYVWELDWSILRIGSLGKGQLQIKDANKEPVFTSIGREAWFEILKEKAVDYYNDRISTIQNKYLVDWV